MVGLLGRLAEGNPLERIFLNREEKLVDKPLNTTARYDDSYMKTCLHTLMCGTEVLEIHSCTA